MLKACDSKCQPCGVGFWGVAGVPGWLVRRACPTKQSDRGEKPAAVPSARLARSGKSRLKGGCSQDWLPHKGRQPRVEVTSDSLTLAVPCCEMWACSASSLAEPRSHALSRPQC